MNPHPSDLESAALPLELLALEILPDFLVNGMLLLELTILLKFQPFIGSLLILHGAVARNAGQPAFSAGCALQLDDDSCALLGHD